MDSTEAAATALLRTQGYTEDAIDFWSDQNTATWQSALEHTRATVVAYLRAEENNPARPAWFRGALGQLVAEVERGGNPENKCWRLSYGCEGGVTPADLKAARKRLGLSQLQFARELGMKADRQIRRMEKGQSPIHKRTEIAVEKLLADRGARAGGADQGEG
jgi:hypothetical protein